MSVRFGLIAAIVYCQLVSFVTTDFAHARKFNNEKVTISGDYVNLRQAASKRARPICSLREGDKATAHQQRGSYVQVYVYDRDNKDCHSERGWVHYKFVKRNTSVPLPVQNKRTNQQAEVVLPVQSPFRPPLPVKKPERPEQSDEEVSVNWQASIDRSGGYRYVLRPGVNFRDIENEAVINSCSLVVNDRVLTGKRKGIYTAVTVVDRTSSCNGMTGFIATEYLGARVNDRSASLLQNPGDMRGSFAELATERMRNLFDSFTGKGVPEAGLRRLMNHFEANYDSYPNKKVLTLIDFRSNQPSNKPRKHIMFLKSGKLMSVPTAHGSGSGVKYATRFSNRKNSNASSLGFYRTAETYYGKHGKSLRLDGLSKTNSNAYCRYVVVHKAWYMSPGYIKRMKRAGRSWGCPAMRDSHYWKFLKAAEGGSAYYIWNGENTDSIRDSYKGRQYSCTGTPKSKRKSYKRKRTSSRKYNRAKRTSRRRSTRSTRKSTSRSSSQKKNWKKAVWGER